MSTQRFAQELTMWSDALTGCRKKWAQKCPDYGYFSIVLTPDPSRRPPRRQRTAEEPDCEALRERVQNARAEHKSWTLPDPESIKNESIENKSSAIQGTLDLSYGYQEIWQLHKSGAFMYSRGLLYDLQPSELVIRSEHVIALIALAVQFAQRLYEAFPTTKVVAYEVQLEGVRDHVMGNCGNDDRHSKFQAKEMKIPYKDESAVLDLRSDRRSVVERIVLGIFEQFKIPSNMSRVLISKELDAMR